METGICIALMLLVLGLVFTLQSNRGAEGPTAILAMLMVMLILGLTLATTNTPKTVADELKALQQHCIRHGIATMTPVVTQSEFRLLPVTIAEATIECGSATAGVGEDD